MLSTPALKERFFTEIDSVAVFEKETFLEFLKLRVLDSSYTRFSNKIGLSITSHTGANLLKSDSHIVLNFPYKDCILKGAQSKDEDKSDEIFFNEILGSDEIDVLFKPKVLQNFELIDSSLRDSQRESKQSTNLKSAILNKPNLLIKGNNLLALHSLKKRKDIYGQVKLIYIDPPYNTGNDSFNYNDKFNHSAWLTFMKNRLEIAKEFLRDDGVIFVQCDDNEQAYLKVLMDEIFGRENFVSTLIWEKKRVRQNDARWYSTNHEYILNYAKKKELFKPNPLERTAEMLKIYKNPDNDKRGLWVAIPLSAKSGNDSMKYTITFPNGVTYETKYGYPRYSKEKLLSMYYDNRLYFGKNGTAQPSAKKFLSEVRQGVVNNTFMSMDEVGSTQQSANEIKSLFTDLHTDLFSTPKPEALLKRIIEISTQENDLVMDFFAGSGTTLAVAHKMKRRFVGVEQMDYIESITKERLIKVINGEQGGISKAVGWNPLSPSLAEGDKGGGLKVQKNKNAKFANAESTLPLAPSAREGELPKNEFIYCELMPLNALYKARITQSQNDSELARIYKDLEQKAFIDYRVDIKALLKDKDFESLDLESKKQILCEILDSNMDYVPYGDIEDSSYGVDREIIELNKAFYGDL